VELKNQKEEKAAANIRYPQCGPSPRDKQKNEKNY